MTSNTARAIGSHMRANLEILDTLASMFPPWNCFLGLYTEVHVDVAAGRGYDL